MNAASLKSEQNDAETIKIFTNKIKTKLTALRELRHENGSFRSLQNELYVDVLCSQVNTVEKDYESSSLKTVVLDFIKNRQDQVRTLNVYGESGSGKSAAMLKIEETLWNLLDVENIGVVPQFFPLFMILKTVTYPIYRLMTLREVALHSLGNILSMEELDELEKLRLHLKLSPVWLLDGFDEMGRLQSISTDLYECGIAIVTCHQQYLHSVLGSNVEKFLIPRNYQGDKQGQYEQIGILPFNESQVEEFLNKWVEASVKRQDTQSNNEVCRLNEVINALPNSKEFSRTPYLLTLLCTLILSFTDKHESIKEKLPSSYYDYDTSGSDKRLSNIVKVLVETFIAKGMSRFLNESDWAQKECEEYPLQCQRFCENVAFQMFEAKERTYTINVGGIDSKDNDNSFVIDTHSLPLQVILQSIPLIKVGDSSLYAFPHKSLWEYFLACRSMRLPEETLGHELFTQDCDLLLIHADMLARQEGSVEEYIQIVLNSRQKYDDPAEDKRRVTAASNALSILNFAAVDDLIPFKFEDVRDWRGIRVPDVNLNYAKILRCEFDGADLSRASLIGAFVAASRFKEVILRGATCGIKSILNGHTAKVNSIAIHMGNEKLVLASGSEDKAVRMWDVETGDCKFISPQAERVWDSPAGSIVAFTSRTSNCIFLWDTLTRKFCGTLDGHTRHVECFCFSMSGKIGASGSEDGTVRIWDIAAKKCLQILRMNSPVNSVAMSPDENNLVSASYKWTHFWDLKTGKCTNQIKTDHIASVLYHPNGKLITMFGHFSTTVEVLDAETAVKTSCINLGEKVSKASFLPDGSLAILAKGLEVWDIEANTRQISLEEKSGSDCTFALSHDLSVIVTVSSHGDISGDTGKAFFNLWDMKTFELISTFEKGPNIPNNICISHDNAFILATYSNYSTFSLWDMKTGEQTKLMLGHIDSVKSVTFRPESSHDILVTSSQKGVRLWDKDNNDSWDCFYSIKGGVGLSKIAFSPDGNLIVGSHLGRFVMFDYDKRKIVRTLSGSHVPQKTWASILDPTQFVTFSPDGHYFACLIEGRTKFEIYETASRNIVKEIDTVHFCYYICFSPNGDIIGYATNEGITIMNWRTGQYCLKIETSTKLISFHPTNNHVLASTDNEQIQLWDVLTGKCLRTLTGHVGGISSLTFTADGLVLASGGVNGSILLWDLTGNQCLPKVSMKKSPDFRSIHLSHDGRTLVAAGKGLYLYDITTSKLIETLLLNDWNVDHVSFNYDGSLLVYSTFKVEAMVEIMDMKKREPIQKFRGFMPSFNADGAKVLYINDAICVWDIAKGETTLSIDFVDGDTLTDACFSPDGSMIVASFEETGAIYYWNAVTGQEIKTVEGISDACKITMSQTGDMSTFLTSDSLKIWDIEKQEPIASFHGCEKVTSSADGSKLALIRRKSIVLFDMKAMKVISSFEGHSTDVKCVDFHPSGRFVISCCTEMIFVWDVETMQPHSVMGINKALQFDCDLHGAQLDEAFRRTISNLFIHLFSSRIDMTHFAPFDKEEILACLETGEDESDE